jgi:hypothetical protein
MMGSIKAINKRRVYDNISGLLRLEYGRNTATE